MKKKGTDLFNFLPSINSPAKIAKPAHAPDQKRMNQVRDFAEVDKDKTPHSARHGMGGHYGKNRQCGCGATAVGAQERFLFSAVFPNNQR
jgi:hypothetical protein